MSAKHTPGPWEVKNGTDIFGPLEGDSGDGAVADKNDAWQVADCNVGATFFAGELTELGYSVRQANARRIVQCVNAHDELVAALTVAEKRLTKLAGLLDGPGKVQWFPEIERIRAALSSSSPSPVSKEGGM